MPHNNTFMHTAKREKRDEFYTRYEDVEHNLELFDLRGLSVYCPCDTDESAFVRCLRDHFGDLGLSRLEWSYFSDSEPVYHSVYDGIEVRKERMRCDGDFRSAEVGEIASHCDVIMTNPPFSLLRQFVDFIIGSGKKWFITANNNLIKYPPILEGFMSEEYHLAYTTTHTYFRVPADYDSDTSTDTKRKGGERLVGVSGVMWIANFGKDGYWPLELSAETVPDTRIDGTDTVDIDHYSDIPRDYGGIMAVPLSYLYHHDPSRYAITGIDRSPKVGGRALFVRLLIQRKSK